jgi:hypothetical protein
MSSQEGVWRPVRSIPDRRRGRLMAHDGNDTDTKFPPITRRRRSNGAMARQ